MDTLVKWNDKVDGDRTFDNIQTHARDTFHKLKKVGSLAIKDSNLHLLQKLKDHQKQISVNMIQQVNQSNTANLAQVLEFQPLIPEKLLLLHNLMLFELII